MIGLFRGSGLEGTPAAIRAVLARYPGANALEAAHTVLAWWHGGRTRTFKAGPLLDAALGGQRARIGQGYEGPKLDPPPADPEAWAPIAERLRGELPDHKFAMWVEPCELVRIDGQLTLRAPDHMRSWVRDRYRARVAAAVRDLLNEPLADRVVDPDWHPSREESDARVP